MKYSLKPGLMLAVALAALAGSSPLAWAQPGRDLPDIVSPLDRLSAELSGAKDQQLQITARFTAPSGPDPARLFVQAVIAPGWHVYSITQPSGGPTASKIQLRKSPDYRLQAKFTADPKPLVKPPEVFPVESQEHYGRVTWSAPLRLAPAADLAALRIEGTFRGQVCQAKGTCIPLTIPFVAKLSANQLQISTTGKIIVKATGEYQPPGGKLTIRGHLEPAVVAPGGTAKLVLTAIPQSQWHIYAYADRDPEEVSKPTLIVLSDTSGFVASRPVTQAKIIEQPMKGMQPLRYHHETVTWTVKLDIPADAEPGQYPLSGLMGFMTCTESTCDKPRAVSFQAQLTVGKARQSKSGQLPLDFSDAEYADAAQAAKLVPAVTNAAPAAQGASSMEGKSIAAVLGLAFLAGLILNVMPCVLPVIGLKIMSFVQQAGENRAQIFMLNVWYSLGLLSVFMVLATLAYFMKLGWGAQFADPRFNIAMTGVVFVFALSLLGVWEVPIPGFVGTGKANELSAQEGVVGAFCKGALTTVLATPCTGPFLGAAIGWAIAQPVWLNYTTFAFVGLGMASPYLLIGAFPSLIGALPKPGAWMDAFKQLMGFALMGAVVWLIGVVRTLEIQNEATYLVPTLAFLLALGIACWWIGRTPLTASVTEKVRAWAGGAILPVVVGIFAFTENKYVLAVAGLLAGIGYAILLIEYTWSLPIWRGKVTSWVAACLSLLLGAIVAAFVMISVELPWEPYTRTTLDQHRAQGHTVLVDFTAHW